MTKRLRMAVVAGALAAALGTAGSAWASYSPQLLVKSATSATNGAITITTSVGQNDDPTGRTEIFVPVGYTIDTSAAAGTKIGTVDAKASAADLNNTVLTLTGELDVVNANAAAAAQCGVATVAATWDLHLSAAGQTIDIPMFVAPTGGALATVSPFMLVVCLPPPDVPVGTPGRSVFGAKLLTAAITTTAIHSPTTTGQFRWTSLWTPYVPGKGTPNAAGSVEAQSLVQLPSEVRIVGLRRVRQVHTTNRRVKGKIVKQRQVRTSVTFQTQVTQGGSPVAGAKVTARAAGKSLGTATTTSTGRATAAFVLLQGTATISVTAVIPDVDMGATGCVRTPAFAGVPCVDLTEGGSTHVATATVTAYKR